jgi:hypothetical protein
VVSGTERNVLSAQWRAVTELAFEPKGGAQGGL